MNTNTKPNADLELRPFEDEELQTVSGGYIPPSSATGSVYTSVWRA